MSAPAPIALVAGTWGRDPSHGGWWRAGSEFRRMLLALGVPLVGADDANAIFSWTTRLDGVDGDNADWDEAGKALVWYAHAQLSPDEPGTWKPVSVIAHSHGGNVLAYAAWHGLAIDTAITLATPVRADMEVQYRMLAQRARRWVHVYTDERTGWGWQILGAAGWNTLFAPVHREMAHAHENVYVPGYAHGDLVRPGLWLDQRWAPRFFG